MVLLVVVVASDAGYFDLPSFFKEIVIFLGISTIGLYRLITNRIGSNPSDFVKIYLGVTVLRILFFGGFIFVIIKLDPDGAIENTVLFLVCYFLFTILEVGVLFRKINARKSSQHGQKDL